MKSKPTALVIDSNVLLKTVLIEEYSYQIIEWLQGIGTILTCHAPTWIYLECAHTLQKVGRRFPDIYPPDQLFNDFQRLQRIDIALYAFEPYTDRAVTLAQQFGISVYDGVFLSLAEHLHLPLLTDDRRLITCMKDQPAFALWSVSDYFCN